MSVSDCSFFLIRIVFLAHTEGELPVMPALHFMGRRWGVGADEFALPSLCSMLLRVMWSVALVVVLVRTRTD